MKIADSIGINRATFTRFAGCNWLRGDRKGDIPIPDLWLNTAHTLAKYPVFVKAAQAAGVLPRVKKVLEDSVKRSQT